MPESIVAEQDGSFFLYIQKISTVSLTLKKYGKLKVLHLFSSTPHHIKSYLRVSFNLIHTHQDEGISSSFTLHS
jgi:hypothetical protein